MLEYSGTLFSSFNWADDILKEWRDKERRMEVGGID